MAKKFVRGVTDVDDIEKFDKTLTNVNDLVSDGKNTYVHTKKGKNEFYYKVTDGVTSVNSTGGTINIEKSDDGALKLDINPQKVLEHDNLNVGEALTKVHSENTTILDVNPQKVLEHDNLLTDYGISKTKSGNNTTLGIEYTSKDNDNDFDLNNLSNGLVRSGKFLNAPQHNTWYFVSSFVEGKFTIQEAITLVDDKNTTYRRLKKAGTWGPWREQAGDKSVIDGLLAQKQNTLQNNTSIGVSGNGLQQLYSQKQSYSHANGIFKTHVKSVSSNTSVTTPEEEFNFIVKINKGATSATFTLNEQDKTKFTNIITTYGQDNTVSISGCVFTLSGSTLTVSTSNNTSQNYVITFSDII